MYALSADLERSIRIKDFDALGEGTGESVKFERFVGQVAKGIY